MNPRPSRAPSRAEAGSFLAAAVVLAPLLWELGFNLGAYVDVHYPHLFAIWSASVAALLATAWIGRTREGDAYFTWKGALILLLPSAWFACESLLHGQVDTLSLWVRGLVTLLTLGLALPYILYIVAAAALPELEAVRSPRLRLGLVTICCAITVASFSVGSRNDLVLTCRDFDVAGAARPHNCFRDTASSDRSPQGSTSLAPTPEETRP